MHKTLSFEVSDCHLVLETASIAEQKEHVYSHGNRRVQESSRLRSTTARPSLAGSGQLPELPPRELAERWLTELDGARVTRGILLCEAPTTRDEVAAVAALCKDRLVAFTSLDPVQTWSAEDLSRDVARGFAGLHLLPTLQHFHVFDRRAYPVYETAERLRVPLAVHFGQTRSTFADLRFANPLDLQPVARDFPGVAFVVAGLGQGFLRELLMVMDNCPNVATDTSGDASWLRTQSTRLTLDEAVRMVLDVGGPGRLLFGSGSGARATGYRRDLLQGHLELVERLGLSEADAALVFGGNLTRLIEGIDRASATEKPQRLLRLRTPGRPGDEGR